MIKKEIQFNINLCLINKKMTKMNLEKKIMMMLKHKKKKRI